MDSILPTAPFFEEAPLGFAILDSDFRYVRMNRCLGEFDEVDPSAVPGHSVAEVLPELAEKLVPIYRSIVGGEMIANRAVQISSRAVVRSLNVSYFPVTIESGMRGIGAIIAPASPQRRHSASPPNTEECIADQKIKSDCHELRNQVGIILNWVRLLQKSATPDLQHGLGVLERNARAQEALLAHLLSAPHAEGIAVAGETLDLRRLLTALVDEITPAAYAKGVQVSLLTDGANAWIHAERDAIHQAFLNLAGNAIKYTPGGGKVEMLVVTHSEQVVVRITDTGCGIDPAFLPRLFSPYVREQGNLLRVDGLGLGLNICRNTIERHGGSIEAASRGRHLGSTFTVRLPIVKKCTA